MRLLAGHVKLLDVVGHNVVYTEANMGRSPLRTLDYKPRLDIDINLDVTAKTQKAQNIMKYIISYADIKFNTLVSNPRLLSFRFYPLIFLLLFCLSVYSYLLPNNTNKSFPSPIFIFTDPKQSINQLTNPQTHSSINYHANSYRSILPLLRYH